MPSSEPGPGTDPNSGTEVSPSVFGALRYRDFRLLWGSQFISITGSQMQLVAINWHVYLLTKSAVALGLVGLVRILPIVICSLIGGVVADAFDRRRLMIFTQSTMLLSACVLALITATGLTRVWPIYLLTAIASAATAFDNPARQSLIPSLVPYHAFPNAVSLGLISFQAATVAGPLMAGLMLSTAGPAAVYAANAASFLAVIIALFLICAGGRNPEQMAGKVSIAALSEGLKFVWRTPIIVQTMTLDFIATFFASATALLPIFASDILHVSEKGYGVLAAAQAGGAVLAALVLARSGQWSRPGASVVWAVAVYGAATVMFGMSRVFWLSVAMLAVAGASDTVSTVIRQTIRQLVTPDHLRGRMTSVNMIFFMGGPQFGEFEAGVAAKYLGAPLSVVTGGLGCLAAVLLVLVKGKELLSYRWAPFEDRKIASAESA